MTLTAQKRLLMFVVLLVLGLVTCHKQSQLHSVTLTWHESPSTQGIAIVGYNVYRRTTPGVPYVRIATRVPRTTYEDRIVNSGTTYLYAVTAVDQRNRESGFSSEATVKVP